MTPQLPENLMESKGSWNCFQLDKDKNALELTYSLISALTQDLPDL